MNDTSVILAAMLQDRLREWQQHLRALVPRDGSEGAVVVRPVLVEALLDDLAAAVDALDANARLRDTLGANLGRLVGDADVLRALAHALQGAENATNGDRPLSDGAGAPL